MSNSARSALRTKVRNLLNEPTAGFWSDAVLNDFLQNAYDHYYREYVELNPEHGRRYHDFTYTGSAEYTDLTTTGYDIEQILQVEDRTDSQPGSLLEQSDSLGQLIRDANEYAALSVTSNTGFKWAFEKIESISSGVVTVTERIYFAPVPTAARSIRIHVQCAPQVLSGDTYTTGLPEFVERCIILMAAMDARLMELNPNLGNLPMLLEQAEQRMYRHTRPVKRGPMSILYEDLN